MTYAQKFTQALDAFRQNETKENAQRLTLAYTQLLLSRNPSRCGSRTAEELEVIARAETLI